MLLVLLNVSFAVGGYGALRKRPWSRKVLMWASGLLLVSFLAAPIIWHMFVESKLPPPGPQVRQIKPFFWIPNPTLVIYLVNLWFFSRTTVVSQFRAKSEENYG